MRSAIVMSESVHLPDFFLSSPLICLAVLTFCQREPFSRFDSGTVSYRAGVHFALVPTGVFSWYGIYGEF